MTRGKRGGKGGARKRSANPAPIAPAPGSPVLAMAILAAGAVAMIAGASTYSWWRFSANEGLGLREIHVCASNGARQTTTLDALLPRSFGPEFLPK